MWLRVGGDAGGGVWGGEGGGRFGVYSVALITVMAILGTYTALNYRSTRRSRTGPSPWWGTPAVECERCWYACPCY